MDVSVVITCRNHAAALPATIASVVAQTLSRQLDVVVADQASTDDTAATLQPYLDRYRNPAGKVTIRSVRLDSPDEPAALNAALDLTRAPYVAFLRAGDYWNRFKLQRQFTAMRESPSVGVVHTAYRTIDEQGQFTDTGAQGLDSGCAGFCLEVLLQRDAVAFSSMLVRRAILDAAAETETHGQPFDPQRPIGHDYDFTLRLARLTRFVFVPQPLTHLGPQPSPAADRDAALALDVEGQALAVRDFLARYPDALEGAATTADHHLTQLMLNRARALVDAGQIADARIVLATARRLNITSPDLTALEQHARPNLVSRIAQAVGRLFRPS